jgi:phosphate transport system substrate-binding protein
MNLFTSALSGIKLFSKSHQLQKAPIIIFLALLLAACSAEPASLPEITATVEQSVTLGLTGSAADLPQIVPDLAQANVTWVVSNSATLYAELEAGNLDAVFVHALPPEIELEQQRWFNPVAVDGVVLVVHPDNPVTDLTLAQTQALFSGQIDNWAQVGGIDQPVEIVSREPGSGVRTLFNQRVMAEQRLTINAVVQPSSVAVREYVATHPGALGYVMLGSLPPVTTEPDPALRLLALDGIAPTPATTANQSYPLSVPLFVVTADSAEPQGLLRLLIARLQSEAGQAQLGVRYGRVK